MHLANTRGITPSRPMLRSRREDAICALMMLAMLTATMLTSNMIL
ncbi:MAG: hypothetical protein ACLT98_09945 [Eggerthellaceae bacterium]